MKIKVKRVWDFIFKKDASLKNIPLQIRRKNVYVDTKIQKILLHKYLSYGK